MRRWLCILVAFCLGGCAGQAGPPAPPSEEGVPATSPSVAEQPLAPAFPLHARESARYEAFSGSQRLGWFELNLSLEGSYLLAAVRYNLPLETGTATATYDASTGRLLELKVDLPPPSPDVLQRPTHYFPFGEKRLLPLWRPDLLLPVDVLPIAAAWLAFNGSQVQGWPATWTDEAWTLDAASLPCRHDCATQAGSPFAGWKSVHVEGASDAVLPAKVASTSESGQQLLLTRTSHWTEGPTFPAPPAPPPFYPPLPMRECGPTPCEDGRLPFSMREGYDALMAHPSWTAWKLAHPDPFIPKMSLDYANGSIGDTSVPNAGWIFVAASEGTPFDMFSFVVYDVAGTHQPILNQFRPAIQTWHEDFAGWASQPERTVWPTWEHVLTNWTAFSPPGEERLVLLGVFQMPPSQNPDPAFQHILSIQWTDAGGRVWVAEGYAEDGHLATITLLIE